MPKLVSKEVTLTQTLKFGPAMSALTDRQRSFVMLWNNGGHKNGAECAREAGFSPNAGDENDAGKRYAYTLLHDPKIKRAIIEDLETRIVGQASWAVDKITEIASTDGHAKQYDALKFISRQAGLIEKQHIEVTHTTDTRSFAEMLQQAKSLAMMLGPKHLAAFEEKFGHVVIDADYVTVEPEPELSKPSDW
jgi:hypothetical protein